MAEKRKDEGLTLPRMLFKGAFIFNPVLTQAIGLCPIVAMAYSVKSSAVLSATLAVMMILNELFACFAVSRLPRWLRVSCYLVFSTVILAIVMPVFDIISSDMSAAMGIYLPLLAVNSLVVVRCEKFAVTASMDREPRRAALYCVYDALSAGIGYAAVIMLTAFIRGQLMAGRLFGLEIPNLPKITAMSMPFCGLIVLAFIAAVHKLTVRRFFPDETTETFDMSSSLKTPLLVDPGLHARDEVTRLIDEPFTEKERLRAQNSKSIKKSSTEVVPDYTDPFARYDYNPERQYVRAASDFSDDDDVFVAIPVEESADDE